MSTATYRADRDYRCSYCGEERPEHRVRAGYDFCSEACYRRNRGEHIIKQVQHEHKFCATCFRRLKHVDYAEHIKGLAKRKDIYRAAPDNFIGLQAFTPHATPAEREVDELDAYRRIYQERPSGCVCGATHHADVHGFIRDLEDDEDTARRLFAAIEDLAERKSSVPEPDREAFDAGWADGGPVEAAGRACYG